MNFDMDTTNIVFVDEFVVCILVLSPLFIVFGLFSTSVTSVHPAVVIGYRLLSLLRLLSVIHERLVFRVRPVHPGQKSACPLRRLAILL